MAVHKLANGPIVLLVNHATETEGNFGPQVCFSDGETEVYVSANTAAQQLGRMKLDLESVVGETLAMEQVKKDGKTYTNITRANAGATANAGTRPAVAAPAPKVDPATIIELYGDCVQAALAKFARPLDEAGIPLDAQAVQAAAATIFIALKGRA
jgi:hypothetical protein